MLKTFKVTKESLLKSANAIMNGGLQTEDCAIASLVREVLPLSKFNGMVISKDGSYRAGTYIKVNDEVREYARLFDDSSYEERLNLPEFEFQLNIPNEL